MGGPTTAPAPQTPSAPKEAPGGGRIEAPLPPPLPGPIHQHSLDSFAASHTPFDQNEGPHSPNEEFEEYQAQKLLSGLSTFEELALKFGPKVTDAIMMRAQKKTPEEVARATQAADVPPASPVPRAPNAQYKFIPAVLDHYKGKKSEEDEREYLGLLKKLKEDERFVKILDDYKPLMEIYPDWVEWYEQKAMRDFYELNERLAG
jgi:hypothetical protein